MIQDNLIILFLLLPCMLITWWWFIRLINWSMGFNLRETYGIIYKDPMAAAILRVGIMLACAYLVGQAFGRIV